MRKLPDDRRLMIVAIVISVFSILSTALARPASSGALTAQGATTQEGRYRTRQSDCHYEPPPGKPLAMRKSDTGISIRGYIAERVLTYTADVTGLESGELVVCSEYGRVEIVDSDDDHVRVQIRMDAFGEGASQPGAAAKRAIDRGVMREAGNREFKNQEQVESPGYDQKPLRSEVRATSELGKVVIASVPAAPLPAK